MDNNSLSFSKQFSKRMIWLSVVIGLITALALPVTYVGLSYQNRLLYATLRSELLAQNIQLAIADNPELWYYDIPRFVELTHRLPQEEMVAGLRVYNRAGNQVYKHDFSLAPAYAISTKAPIKYQGQVYGMLEVVENMEDLLQAALLTLAFFGLLGLSFAFAIYKLPMRIIVTAEHKVFSAIDELQATQQNLREMAITDTKTGLFNASYLMKKLIEELELAEVSGEKLWLLLLDIDYFKKYNDRYGHVCGDVLLAEMAVLLSGHLRSQDTFGRYGGEEFLLIMPECDAVQAEIVALRLRGIVATHDFSGEDPQAQTQITLSIGMAQSRAGIKAEQLIREADAAMYAAKEAGRNRVCSYSGGAFSLGGVVMTRISDISFASQSISEIIEKISSDDDNRILSPDVTILASFLKTLLARESETAGHCLLVNKISMLLGNKMGLSEKELLQLNWGSLLHDIGKLAISDSILLKAGLLTDSEYATVKKHPTTGYELLQHSDYLGAGKQIILYHHEKWDGTGYPERLMSENIPLLVRICTLADSVAAMAIDHPYRKAMPASEIIAQIHRNSGTQFDPSLVEVFDSITDELFNDREFFNITKARKGNDDD